MIRAMIPGALAMLMAWGAPAATDDPAAVRAAVSGRLASMEGAVLAGDAAAYMANVAAGDPEFTQEQRHWAEDLGLHTPAEFTLAFVGAAGSPTPDESAEVALTVSWKMPGGAGRSVSYPARFVHQDGAWLYAGEAWTEVEGDRVLALCARGLEDEGRDVVEVFPGVRAHDEAGFELAVDRVQKVKLYSSMEHLQESIYLSYVDSLGGWNEPGESIKLIASRGTGRAAYRRLLAHEFGHVCTFEMGPKATEMPWWVLEGAAELAAEGFSRDGPALDGYIHMLAQTGRLGEWEKLSDFRSVPESDYMLVYPQGHHMLAYISEQWGRPPRNAWLRAMAQGETIDRATREVLGIGFDGLDARWRESIGAKPREPAPTPEGK